MLKDIFFVIAYSIMGLIHDKRYGCLTAIGIAIVLLILISKIAY